MPRVWLLSSPSDDALGMILLSVGMYHALTVAIASEHGFMKCSRL